MEGEIIRQPSQGEINSLLASFGETVEKAQKNAVAASAYMLMQHYRIVRFKSRLLVLSHDGFPHFVPLHREQFDKMAYPILGGVSRSRMNDTYSYLSSIAEDYTPYQYRIGFGSLTDDDFEEDENGDIVRKRGERLLPPVVWDTKELTVVASSDVSQSVWRSPYKKVLMPKDEDGNTIPIPFIMSLAGGDQGLYDDIMQSIAPMVMDKKPDGVIWWVGSGANGKSTLMDALYRLFPGQLASMNVKRLVDERDTPGLNGVLANIVKESSDGRIEDSEIYKCLGTHENFRVHKFHSQDDIEVNGNIHNIFSANSIPTFADKGHSIRRRTFIIPFTQTFESDPDFEKRTFTPEFFGQFANEICRYAARLERQGFRYKWSARTLSAKLEYDKESSSAEQYARELIDQGVVAFTSFQPVKVDYENWCAEQGYVPLGVTNLRKSFTTVGFDRVTTRQRGGGFDKMYRLKNIDGNVALSPVGLGRPGLYTLDGFNRAAVEEAAEKNEKRAESILNHKW